MATFIGLSSRVYSDSLEDAKIRPFKYSISFFRRKRRSTRTIHGIRHPTGTTNLLDSRNLVLDIFNYRHIWRWQIEKL